jgi:putative hydrolase of the HAD superfamily
MPTSVSGNEIAALTGALTVEQLTWVIFDADNTLWNVETLYDNARSEFCSYVLNLLSQQSTVSNALAESIDPIQRQRDLQLQNTHGYSAARYARSFEDTLAFLLPFSLPRQLQDVREIALNVFEQDAPLTDGLEVALGNLQTSFKLAIITSGEQWVQERRIAKFGLRSHFSKVVIVGRKSKKVFEEFCQTERVNRDRSWVVGDSVRSDIIPAMEAGLNAIHFEVANWTYETATRPNGAQTARTMAEVVTLINTGG